MSHWCADTPGHAHFIHDVPQHHLWPPPVRFTGAAATSSKTTVAAYELLRASCPSVNKNNNNCYKQGNHDEIIIILLSLSEGFSNVFAILCSFIFYVFSCFTHAEVLKIIVLIHVFALSASLAVCSCTHIL